jgi:hypothetical protein
VQPKVHPAVLVLVVAIGFASTLDLLGELAANVDSAVLADNYSGYTIQVRPGQVVRKTFHPPVDPNTITLSSDAVHWSGRSDPYASHTPIGQADFVAVHPGLTTIKIHGPDTWQFGPVYYYYDILVRDRARPYDLALSQKGIFSTIWNPSGFALRVGDEIVVSYPDGKVLTTDSSILVRTLRFVLGDTGGLTTFRAIRAGTAQLGLQRADGYWLPATIVVSNSSSRFDRNADEPHDGQVMQMGVGESLRVTLKNLPKYERWSVRWEQAGLMPLADPEGIGNPGHGTFGFQALQAGRHKIDFVTQPVMCGSPNCWVMAGKEITLTVSA